MISALQARELTYSKLIETKSLNVIFLIIEDIAKRGCFKCQILHSALSNNVLLNNEIATLNALGYKVDEGDYYTISW
jgi:hypothetical protein